MAAVQAELKSLFSWDAPPEGLGAYVPIDPFCFGVYVVAFIGSADQSSTDAFDFIACSARWLDDNDDITAGVAFPWAERVSGVAILRGFVLMERWDYEELESKITELCNQT